ncbi:MAG: TIGR02186 family protein [Elstera sp.]
MIRGLMLALLLLAPQAARAQAVLADVTHPLVAITTGFSGTDVTVFGSLDEGGTDVIVVLRGPSQTLSLRHKERVFGLWLNGPAKIFTQVPGFYGLAATKPVSSLLSLEDLNQNRLGLSALQASLEPVRATGVPDVVDADRAAVVNELAKRGLIVQKPEPIRLLAGRLFKVSFALPSNVPVGPFQVSVYAVKDRQVIGAITTPLITSQVGIAADVHDWAYIHPLIYALASLALAVLMGGLGFWAFRAR